MGRCRIRLELCYNYRSLLWWWCPFCDIHLLGASCWHRRNDSDAHCAHKTGLDRNANATVLVRDCYGGVLLSAHLFPVGQRCVAIHKWC